LKDDNMKKQERRKSPKKNRVLTEDEKELQDDLRAIREAEKAHKEGRTIPLKEVARQLGIKL